MSTVRRQSFRVSDPDTVAAYAFCRGLLRASRPVEYAVMQLMPTALRPACWAMYAAFVTADNIVDEEEGGAAEHAGRLRAWVDALRAELADSAQPGSDPVHRALADTIRRWDLDVEALMPSFTALGEDASGRRPRTWQEWSLRSQSQNTPWAVWCQILLSRAGLPSEVRQEHLEALPAFLNGLYLTDALSDLAHDLDHGSLTLPDEALAAHGVTENDLVGRHWTPAVEALVADLCERAHDWLEQPALRQGVHPGVCVMLGAACGLYRARIRTAQRLGPALLVRPVELSWAIRLRLLLSARVRAAQAWRRAALASPTAAPTPALPAARHAVDTPAFTPPSPPPPHPSGERPPRIPPENLPRHVAVIMDGNGRWATARGLPRSDGHRAGGEATRDIIHGALELGLSHLTLYVFSTENWRRDTTEIAGIFNRIRDNLPELHTFDIRLLWAGSPEGLPADLTQDLQENTRGTRHRTGLTLTLCINYGGRAELVHAAAALARAAVAGTVDPERINEHLLAAHLPLPELPDVDLLWRTGGEQRISNLLPWHLSYSELHFTDTLWPDMDRRDLWQAITAYTHRRRRYGAAPGSELSL